MIMTTLLLYVIARARLALARARGRNGDGHVSLVDLGFFSANVLKIWQGGWLPS